MKKVLIIVGVILGAVLLSAASFWGGMTYQTNKVSQARANFFASRGGQPSDGQFQGDGQFPSGAQGQQGQGFFRGGGTVGQVKSIEGNVLTLSTAQNVTTVNLTDTTKIMKSVEGTTSDLQTGMRVVVAGERDSKGNITASQITIVNNDGFAAPANTAP
jgi:hypothetical protein